MRKLPAVAYEDFSNTYAVALRACEDFSKNGLFSFKAYADVSNVYALAFKACEDFSNTFMDFRLFGAVGPKRDIYA